MMQNTCLNSAVSLRCRYSPSSQFNDPTYFLDARFDTNPLLISSSYSSCCCCCCAANSNVIYNSLPTISPRYLFNGLRQSTLIQLAPSKRLIFHGSRRQPCNNTSGFSSLTDSDRNYYYEKLQSFKEKRKLGKGRCWGIEDNKKEQSFTNAIDDYADDVEILLDLLTEEVGLENISVRERKRTDKKDRKTKTVGSSLKRDKKHDYKAVKIQSNKEEDRRISNERKEEERRTSVKRVNREHKKEGSSCSSYYSVSSTGEFDSDNDVEIKHDVGESSSEYKDDQRTDSYTSYNEENVERQNQVVKEKGEILKKNTAETYYGNQEWRKKSEKKLDLESSQQQSQVSLHSNRSSQHSEKTDRITNQSQSRTDNKISTSVQNLTTADRVTQKDEYRNQSNVISEASRIHGITKKEASSSSTSSSLVDSRMKNQKHNFNFHGEDRREEKQERIDQLTTLQESRLKSQQTSSSSSLVDSRIKNQEHNKTEVIVDNRRVEKQERIDQLTTLQESRLESQQISRVSDNTQITKTQNSSVSNTQSDIRSEKQELDLKTSSSSQVTMAEHVDLRRKKIEDKYSSSTEVKLVEGTTESMKTGRRTTKASSFHVGMPKEASSSYKALKLNPEPNSQQSGTQLHVGQSSQHFDTTTESSRLQQSEILGLDIHNDVIDSANQEHKSSTQFLGEFVKNANNKLLTSQEQQSEKTHEQDLVYEDAEQHEVKSSDKKDGPSDEMWDVSDNITTSGEASRKSGRSLWNVIGDVVRLRWSSSSRTETQTLKSGGEKASSHHSSSEAWFSGHEHEDSNDDNLKTGIRKDESRRRTDDSPLLSSSSRNPNHGSSSKTMSPSVIEELSFPVPAIRMRRSPVIKSSGSGESDASGSDKMVNTAEVSPASSSGKMVNTSEVSPASSSGKMVIIDEPISAEESKRRKLARIEQVSKDRFDEWEEAYDIEAKQRKNDEFFMKEALLEAKKGADFWEVPVGAVLVHDGKIIARGYNLVEELRDSTAHAEMICIREGSNNLRSWRLSGTTLYVTLEPCPMCAGAILQARIDTVVWGAPNKLLGADGSWIRLFPDGDGGSGSDKPAAPVHPFHPTMKVRRGVLSSECADVMQQFFQLRRKKKEKKIEDEPPTPPPSCLPITHRNHHSKFFSKMHDAFTIMFCL